MADKSKIEWTDATWPVTNGCALESPGCENCYAMKLAHKLSLPLLDGQQYVEMPDV